MRWCSRTRSAPVMPELSFDQAPASEAEKDVFERAAPAQDGLGTRAAAVQPDRRRLAVVGVEKDAGGQYLDTLRKAVQLVECRRAIDRKAKLEHLAAGVLVDQTSWRSGRDD